MLKVLKNIYAMKCPRCQEGDLFTHPAYNLKEIGRMPDNCPVCGKDFKVEIGFYWGAMYVAYAITVGISLLQFLLYFLVLNLSVEASFAILIIVQIIMSPFLYRLSKSLWLHIFVPFGREKHTEQSI